MMKAGDDGAETDFGVDILDSSPLVRRGEVPMEESPGGGTLRDRFLVLRARLLGEFGRPEEAGRDVGDSSLLVLLSRVHVLKVVMREGGDSGEESGVLSVIADSRVDTVVVGEVFADEVVDVETLCWCWWWRERSESWGPGFIVGFS